MKDINKWLNRIKTDEKFAQKNNGKTIEEIIKIAKQQDYDITKEDIMANVSGGGISSTRITASASSTAIAMGDHSKATNASEITINM